MAFAVNCKSCQARFLLNDDLLRRKVAGKVVTVRCRQCHATIEVDASDVDPLRLRDGEKPLPPPRPGLGHTRAPRPAPAPPRPAAKSTLMGIGAPRAPGATELVALSPGLLNVKTALAEPATAQGFPEPPPPPGAVEVLDAGDWDELETPAVTQAQSKEEPVPESLDDFAEELPPSLPPEEEMPSSTGTPSLSALTHHDEHVPRTRSDDFLVNMTAATNGGIITGAPTIDISDLLHAPAVEPQAPSIEVTNVPAPARGSKTLPLFSPDDTESTVRITAPDVTADHAAKVSPGSLSPSTLEGPPPSDDRKSVDSPRARRNVVAPGSRSVPPAAEKKASGLAVPLLVALAAAAGFLIWKRSGTPPAPTVRAEPAVERAPATPPPAPVPTAQAAPLAPASDAPAEEELTFESAPSKPAPATGTRPVSTALAAATPAEQSKPTGVQEPAPKDEVKPQPTLEAQPPAEPAGPFDRAAASAALNASAAQASSCRKEGDPSGVASVVITFAPSGRVTSANISGPPFAGTPTGGCIAATLRKAKIPPFDGERVTVSKTVVIQ